MLKPSTILCFTILALTSSKALDCTQDSDCGLLHECKKQICLHKSLTPLEPIESLASVLIFVMSALASSTGIGGGEIMVPLLILLFVFDTHTAVPLSLSIMLGGNFIKTLMKVTERQVKIDRPIIDYHLVAFILTAMLTGATCGVQLNKVLPDWVILLLMTGLLFYLTVHISGRAHKSLQPIKNKFSPVVDITLPDKEDLAKKPYNIPEVFPLKPVCAIAAIFIVSLVFVFIIGDKDQESLIKLELDSTEYWVLVGVRVLTLLSMALAGIKMITSRTKRLIEENYSFEHDVKWNLKKSLFIASMALLAGLGVGVLGIGGSAIIGPALVYTGVNYEVAMASVGASVLLTCSVTLIQYIHAGMLFKSYSVWLFCIALLGGSLGSLTISYFARRFNKKHLPLFALACILAITTLVTPTYVITNIVRRIEEGSF